MSDPETPELLARRTQKQWRHEDRELSSTHSLWRFAFSIHAAMIPVGALFVRDTKCHCAIILFCIIIAVSFLSMIGIAYLAYLLLRYDRTSASHYAITSLGRNHNDYPKNYDLAAAESVRKATKERFVKRRKIIEPIEIALFIISVLLFLALIATNIISSPSGVAT